MKTTGILLVLFLTFCCFSGVNSNDENDRTKISCDKYKYQDFMVCPNIYSPVCGTNGKTYKHECRICEENMKSGENIGKKYRDKCAEEIYCGIRVSPVPACTREYKAHCGSNDETYNNKCEFCNAVWESMTPLTLKYMGKCESTPQES